MASIIGKLNTMLIQYRQKAWYNEDIEDIKKKLSQCEVTPLSATQKKDVVNYWRKLTNIEPPVYWHEYFYSRNGEFSLNYVPTCLYHYKILYHLNFRPFTMAYIDKCLFDWYFPDVLRPQTVIRNINGYFYNDKVSISKGEALELCKDLGDVVIKPSLLGKWGRGVKLFSTTDGKTDDGEPVSNLLEAYESNYIIQHKVEQHERLSMLNPTSLNTIRVLSFRKGDEVFILYAVVRIGREGKRVDNESAGGINADIDLTTGRIRECAYGTPKEKKILKTDVGTVLDGFQLPSIPEVLSTVKELHKRLPYFNLVGWDFGIDKEGRPVMIEWNRAPDLSQTAHGPAFGEMTEEIVRYAQTLPDTFEMKIASSK